MNGQLDPALIEQILSMEDPAEDPQAQKQAQLQALATKLRAGAFAPPQSNGQMAGGVFLPNTISNIAGMAMQGLGSKMTQGEADQLGNAVTGKRTAGRTAYQKALAGALKRGSAGAGGMSPQTTGFPEAMGREGVGNMDGLDEEIPEY
jgi:hypothetical protein